MIGVTLQWLLDSAEPWTRYRTRVDLLGQEEGAAQVQADREAMLADPRVQALISAASGLVERPIQRHNDASHPIYALSTLADFGLRSSDQGVDRLIEQILAHQSMQGAFQSLVNIPQAFGGMGTDQWAWIACDAPTLLYALLVFGLGDDPRVRRAVEHLSNLSLPGGFRCAAAPELGKFRGPGRKSDPCPIANVYALKALGQCAETATSPAALAAGEMLLEHWAGPRSQKYYLFGAGTDFRKLKYPLIWYDILHVAEALRRLARIHQDPRFQDLLAVIASQASEGGRYTAGSMYQAWKGWSFADKKSPSPWLTFLVLRIFKQSGGAKRI